MEQIDMQLKTGSRCQYYPSRNLELEAINSRGGGGGDPS